MTRVLGVDACKAGWVGVLRADGEAVSLPNPPETFADGWPAAIWV